MQSSFFVSKDVENAYNWSPSVLSDQDDTKKL